MLPRPATTSARCSQIGFLVRILSYLVPLRHVSYVLFELPSFICLSVRFLSLILNLITPPPSPTSPSPTQAPLVIPMLPIHRHVLIAFCRFHFPTLADTISRFSHCISPLEYSNGALNSHCIVASVTHSRGYVSAAGVGIEAVVPPLQAPPTVYSIICL